LPTSTGGRLLLRIDDTDAARNVEGGAEAIAADLGWLGVGWDEGPVRQRERYVRHREAAHTIGEPDADGALRFGQTTLLRADGTPTYQLASAVDDLDFEISHVIRGSDHLANAELQGELIRALGGEPPDYIHHGLLLGEDGTKLSKRHGASSLADLRDAGIPAEAVRAYLEELGLRSMTCISTCPVCVACRRRRLPRCRTRSLRSASVLRCRSLRCCAVRAISRRRASMRRTCSSRSRVPVDAPETLARFRELVEGGLDGNVIVRELKAVGGDLKSVRLALTGRERVRTCAP